MSSFATHYAELDAEYDYPLPEGKFPFTPQEYGSRIAELRKGKKMTQSQLGNYLKISAQAISKIESGQTQIDLEHTKEFGKIFDCTVHYLLGYTDHPHEISVDGAKYRATIMMIEASSICTLDLLLQRARMDPELFSIFSDIFECSNKKREQIKSILKILLE